MRTNIILTILICAICLSASGKQGPVANAPFTEVIVKKKVAGKVCDTCSIAYALDAEPAFSYVITGAGHTPQRFSRQFRDIKAVYSGKSFNSTTHIVSGKNIGITFLPTFIRQGGKKIQLYRNLGQEDLEDMEFSAEQNGKVIKQWTSLSSLDEPRDHIIFGTRERTGESGRVPWQRTYYAGVFDLDIKDQLTITIRNIKTQKEVHIISVLRAEDKATNFVYYQLSLSGDQLSANIQDVLNTRSGKTMHEFERGDSSVLFSKHHNAIGIIRYIGLDKGDDVEYATQKTPYNWRSVNALDPGNGAYVVLGNDLKAGKDHPVYLRYKSQPETIHAITIRVKAIPFRMPWGKIAGVCIFLLVVVGIVSYLLHIRNKRRLATLKLKNADTETRLSLLSGQLNPHFLYNSLTAIQGTIYSHDPGHANAYIGDLAAFMRNVIDNGKKEFVSLPEELKIEEDYLKLEQQRATFAYNITLAPGLDASQIDMPPLLLQPVLENSLRHAFPVGHPDPELAIDISRTGADLHIEITDNGGTPWDTDNIKEGHGRSLTRKRMAVYNEKLEDMPVTMRTCYNADKGTVTTFTFTNWLA
ncbi:sensor histidine kinase [Mucilaginibacter myungsuensis]|uniref:Histidine kinase n=1 Tax=Mucilaginibacter myungsuensis TaxID=649104 RepID=A0A929KZD8_9SPHI|nr:histidine kinase [Mucilaginibacter myungsuensis]MBE9661365.1 histidine kinase [Mucilaginibacter myungsuensis]MDN3597508.1 histidine kinase [Mucilaginibacter myungsuensis]